MIEHIDTSRIGDRIREERERLDLSRKKLGRLIGVTEHHIGQLERGERNTSLTTLAKISQVLKVSIDSFVFDTGEPNNDEKSERSTERAELENLIERCSDQEIEVIFDMLKVVIPHLKVKG
ncbi:helix-turn-helix domain-containing protein [Natranaerobius thermophilus]|uniref:Transcriptional regulator, XRE family n=1 Tax=Natranaerobius thermophilus (strain ATCC BAA-1301 / DSM 18059 / JW/NM-WN-LF) TaxID=457570 RepID=B2A5E0_NATTJ|nr:helix-turn-helix transcriptional regulator [Natranaerobius thermophilus]ACB83974.1 transcriptional regulator, XRE family [Natranaerobius thermophilus JW/NM-WN-LF]